jgi:DNA ligase-associated metallophosphoesterase
MTDRPSGAAAIQIAGEELWLLPERAAFWPARRTLLVADLHLGKPASFRAAGLPVPDAVMDADLARLSRAIAQTRAERLVILGDLVHARSGKTKHMSDAVVRWRDRHFALEMLLVLGNHDRRSGPTPAAWRMQIIDQSLVEPPFVWKHAPDEDHTGYVVAGHLHPVAVLAGPGRQKLRLRCFAVGPRRLILPAFGDFTGGAAASPLLTDRIFVVADDQVLEAPPPIPRSSHG